LLKERAEIVVQRVVQHEAHRIFVGERTLHLDDAGVANPVEYRRLVFKLVGAGKLKRDEKIEEKR
jgi:hypothetical protein